MAGGKDDDRAVRLPAQSLVPISRHAAGIHIAGVRSNENTHILICRRDIRLGEKVINMRRKTARVCAIKLPADVRLFYIIAISSRSHKE